MQIISPSRASSEPPFELRGGVGVGAMLSHQRGDLDGASYLFEAHPALRLGSGLAAELALSGWVFPGKNRTGVATLWGAGLRFAPSLAPRLRLFADGHAGLGRTGGSSRFMFDGGLGLEYALGDRVSLGVFGRYGQIADSREDPRFAAGGAFLGVIWPEETPPPVLHTEPPPRSGESVRGGAPDAGVLLPRDSGASDGMMAGRDAAPDSGSNDWMH